MRTNAFFFKKNINLLQLGKQQDNAGSRFSNLHHPITFYALPPSLTVLMSTVLRMLVFLRLMVVLYSRLHMPAGETNDGGPRTGGGGGVGVRQHHKHALEDRRTLSPFCATRRRDRATASTRRRQRCARSSPVRKVVLTAKLTLL